MIKEGNVYFGDKLAGVIRETDDGYEFLYDAAYASTPGISPISLTMPVSHTPYGSKTLFPFFDGLIPEGWLLAMVADHWKIKTNDRFQLLMAACRDTIGAVTVIPTTENQEL